MYGVVLLMALSGSAQAPDCHRHSCSGCTGGCSGYVVTSCGGGCYGGGCSGSCHGGGHRLFGGHGGGGLFHHNRGCHGSSGCCGGYSCTGGYGCSGGYGCTGGVIGCTGGCSGGIIYGAPMMQGAPAGEPIKDMPKEKKGKDEVSAPATIVLSLPADARVTLDGAVTTSTSATRTFVTPDLTPGTSFVYTLSAQIVRNGQTLTATEKVSVRAGQQTRLDLGTEKFIAPTVAAK